MGVVTDRRRVWRCFYHLPFLWLFNLNFQHVCSKLHSLTTIHYYLILSLVSFSYFIFTSPLFTPRPLWARRVLSSLSSVRLCVRVCVRMVSARLS